MLGSKKKEESVDASVSRQVGRTLGTFGLILILLALVAGWIYTGYYELYPGEEAVVLRLGSYERTETQPGWKLLHLPPPFETLQKVKVSSIKQEEFADVGLSAEVGEGEGVPVPVAKGRTYNINMQTKDNNIVNVSFVVQYRIKSAFESLYKVAMPQQVLRDASQAAVREVVGRTSIDGVLSDERATVQLEAKILLQQILDEYDSGLEVLAVQLQEVQPPSEVRDAFDDVIAASQDASRTVNKAEGYANEILPESRGKAAVLLAESQAYRDTKVAKATGESQRFLSLFAEYERAPQITRRRLYLEAMEAVLPGVKKVVVDPEVGNLLQVMPLSGGGAKLPTGGAQ